MKSTRLIVSVLVAFVVVVSAACGGNDQSVPANAVAVVDGTPITKAELDQLLVRAKKTYTSQKRAFPKAGTAEYQSLQTQAVAYLVQRAQYGVQADSLKITVTDKEIADRVVQLKAQYFGGSQAKLDQQIKEQGYTAESFRDDIRARVLSEKIYAAVTKDTTVTGAQIATYYAANKKQPPIFTVESRDVRHILVKTKPEADKIYDELKAGADFATLVTKNTLDEASKAAGGKMTIKRGETVAPFEAASFKLKTNEISRPVQTQFGFHVIQPVSDVRPGVTLTLKAATAQIKALLLDKAKNEALTKWTTETKKKLDENVLYAVGFEPPAPVTDTTATTTG
ncbi:MAG: peptidylprolyl isomerase [Thermoleophilia bacterium]